MKILLISPTLPPMLCGVGDYSSSLADCLRAMYQTDVVTISSSPAANYQINSWPTSAIAKIKSIVTKENPDVIHFQFPSNTRVSNAFNLLLPIALKRWRPIITIHEYELRYSWLSKIRTQLMARLYSRVIVTNTHHQKLFAEKAIQASLIPIAHPFKDSVLDLDFTVKEKASNVCFFGFVGEHKQVRELVNAIRELSNLNLTIIGPYDKNEPYHNEVKSNLGTNDRWLADLSLEEISHHLIKSDLAVLPFADGASPKNSSLLAVMAVGLPALTTNPLVYPLTTDVTATVEGSIKESVASLAADKSKRRILSKKGRDLIRNSFTWQNVGEKHLELYELHTESKPSKQ